MSYRFAKNIDTIVPICALIEDYQTLVRAKQDGDWSLVDCVAECIADVIDSCPMVGPANNSDAEAPAMDPYERYQLEWMLSHGYSLRDLIKSLAELQRDNDDVPVDKLFDEWERDSGFSSEIWACKPEWEETEAKGKAARIDEYPAGLKFFPTANSLIAMDYESGIICRPDGSDVNCAAGHGVSGICCDDCERCALNKSCDYENGEILLETGHVYKMGGYPGESEKLFESLDK